MGLTLIIPLRNSTKVPLDTLTGYCVLSTIIGRRGRGAGLPFDWNIQVGNVVQNEVHKRLVSLLAEELDERLRWQGLAKFVGDETVLSERIVELADD